MEKCNIGEEQKTTKHDTGKVWQTFSISQTTSHLSQQIQQSSKNLNNQAMISLSVLYVSMTTTLNLNRACVRMLQIIKTQSFHRVPNTNSNEICLPKLQDFAFSTWNKLFSSQIENESYPFCRMYAWSTFFFLRYVQGRVHPTFWTPALANSLFAKI